MQWGHQGIALGGCPRPARGGDFMIILLMAALLYMPWLIYKGPRRQGFTPPVTSGESVCNATGEAND